MKPEESQFLVEVVTMVRELSPASVLALAEALEGLADGPQSADVVGIAQSVSQPSARAAVARLLSRWAEVAPPLAPSSLAWALRAASRADELGRDRESIELVWSGPAPTGSMMRRTDQALLELVGRAKESLVIVTFAAYRIPHVAHAMLRAAERGVSILLILESSEASAQSAAVRAIEAVGKSLAARCSVYFWPRSERPLNDAGHHGSLHVKCAIADDEAILISSANLTEYAMNLNMELGVLIQGGNIPQRVAEHLGALIRQGVLREAGSGMME